MLSSPLLCKKAETSLSVWSRQKRPSVGIAKRHKMWKNMKNCRCGTLPQNERKWSNISTARCGTACFPLTAQVLESILVIWSSWFWWIASLPIQSPNLWLWLDLTFCDWLCESVHQLHQITIGRIHLKLPNGASAASTEPLGPVSTCINSAGGTPP